MCSYLFADGIDVRGKRAAGTGASCAAKASVQSKGN
jgi:hypothetical protein